MKVHKRVLTLVLSLVMLLALAACGGESGGEETGGPETGEVKDTITVAVNAEPSVLDPPNQQSGTAGMVNVQIYEGLVRLDNETGEIVPCLAESWEQIDDYTIRFHLRDDVYFHDGSKLTAEDVKFTFDRGAVAPMKAMIFEPFDTSKTKIIDENTIELGTKEVFPPFLTYLTNNATLIVSKSAVEAAGSDEVFGRNPVGTGAYKFVEWIAGDRIVLERNEEYWGELPEFKNLVIRTITDDTTRAMALENGEIDIAYKLAPAQMEMLAGSETSDIVSFPGYATEYCALNEAYEPLSDVRVRQAMRYALDLDTMTEIAFGNGVVADGPVMPNISCYVPPAEGQEYGQDIEKAKALMKEAGYENGFDLTIAVNENIQRSTMAEMLANSWKEIGINATVQTIEFSTLVEDMYAGNTQAFIMGFTAGGDDGSFFGDIFVSDSDSNWLNYSNPELDELFELAAVEMDPEVRRGYYVEIQDILRDDMPWLWLRFSDNIFGVSKDLTGFDQDPETYCEFRFVKSK